MDLRTPSGLFFLLLGAILLAMGVVAPEARAPLTQVNLNLYAGAVIALFGGILFWLAKRQS